jgi:alkylation response protein AidB-like acyl-CoA dehydrogenase
LLFYQILKIKKTMAGEYISMDNLNFLLKDVHQVEDVLDAERFHDYDMESFEIMLNAAKDLADKVYFPCFREMDEQPAYYEDGKVIVHPKLEEIINKTAENGWLGSCFDYENGGMQLPQMIFHAASHIFQAANNHVVGYNNLTTGSANLIVTFGSQELKDLYVPKMLSGKWMGTMALTEPQAGSSLSDITTSASPLRDGSYSIKGQKIFISGGDHQFAENFVHLTLARIEGAPPGTRGISLFVVPKFRPDNNNSLSNNDVIIAGDFQKMGQKGYATTHLVYGENNDCRGYLVGEANLGLKYMFQMMNEARIDVGLTAASTAMAAYYASLQYAKERPQGRLLSNSGKKDKTEEQTLIINHPDVRRMLFLQKAITEGALSLLFECSKLIDLHQISEGEEKENYHLLLEFLTPIAKTYPSELGRESINNGLQVLGGYGFCNDFPLQQYYRDIRIMSLYEGTTGIQSLDLLARKVPMANGKALKLIMGKINETLEIARKVDELKPYAEKLAEKLKLIGQTLQYLSGFAQKGDFESYLADATVFMEMTSTIVVAWQWLKQAIVAKNAIESRSGKFEKLFYESKIHTMKFYFKYELTKTTGLAETLLNPERLTILKEKELIL